MRPGGCNSLEVSTSISALVGDVPVNLSANFSLASLQGQLANQVVTVPVGASAAPLGAVPASQLGFLFIENLDDTNPLFLSVNPDGSAPFAKILAGAHELLNAMPGVTYYLRADSAPIEISVLALSS